MTLKRSEISDITTPLSGDEATVLQIAASGQSMIAVGRWEEPAKSLVRRGFLKDMSGDMFNCVITDAGQAAMQGQEAEDDRALGRQIDALRAGAVAQQSIQAMAEQCAQVLVKIAEASAVVTGDTEADAADNWAKVIRNRARELLR